MSKVAGSRGLRGFFPLVALLFLCSQMSACGRPTGPAASASGGAGQPSPGGESESEGRSESSGAGDRNEVAGEAKEKEKEKEKEKGQRELRHHVVAADRIVLPYVLLLSGGAEKPPTPTRAELQAMVRAAFPDNLEDPEVRRLLEMIAREPSEGGMAPRLLPGGGGDPLDPAAYARAPEHLALLIEVIAADMVVGEAVLADFELTRGLSSEERRSLPKRRWALILRGEYRNQYGVRGLRLLQTLVRVVAREKGALIHDVDTLETVNVDDFSARRLRAGVDNIADQIPVVPFPDPAYPGRLRLVTRGMRRFGSVDLELGGLPMDPHTLARATFFLHGLARTLVGLGEVDRSGIAVEIPETIRVDVDACSRAYAGREASLPRCQDCPEEVDLHLVEREREPQDPPEHIVARVVAPRAESDAPGYDQSVWVRSAIARLFGTAEVSPSG